MLYMCDYVVQQLFHFSYVIYAFLYVSIPTFSSMNVIILDTIVFIVGKERKGVYVSCKFSSLALVSIPPLLSYASKWLHLIDDSTQCKVYELREQNTN